MLISRHVFTEKALTDMTKRFDRDMGSLKEKMINDISKLGKHFHIYF